MSFSGSIVGQYYGVIRDPGVTVKTCNGLPFGSGSTSTVLECVQDCVDDLQSERNSDPDGRAVINLSLGGEGCYGWFDGLFQDCMYIQTVQSCSYLIN